MWNNKKSLILSAVCVYIAMLALILALIFAPMIYGYLPKISRSVLAGSRWMFLCTVYIGALPAATLLYSLAALLTRIRKDRVFVPENVGSLRLSSWALFAGAIVAAVSAFYYFPWLIVAICAGFTGLIVRVVKNVFSRAVELQNDADYTI